MHPDQMLEVLNQRAAERRAEARNSNLARALRKAARQRGRAGAPDVLAQPIPDYVDGTFRGAENVRSADHVGAVGR